MAFLILAVLVRPIGVNSPGFPLPPLPHAAPNATSSTHIIRRLRLHIDAIVPGRGPATLRCGDRVPRQGGDRGWL